MARLERGNQSVAEREGTGTAYRKRRDKQTWHSCRNCPNWPMNYYEEESSKPTTGELCQDCQAKEKATHCK
jgi:hypothetical protein